MKIGGSKASSICGINPWETPLEAYLKITGQITTPDNPAMYWGRKLEPIVRQRYQEETGRIVAFNDDPEKYGIEFQHPAYEFIVGSLDGISHRPDGSDNRVLEVKTARSRDAWTDGVPEWYQCQVMHYLACTGFQVADVAVLFGASDFDIFEVERDDSLIDSLIQIEVDFWNNHLAPGIPPEPVSPEDRNLRWPTSSPIVQLGDDTAMQLCADLKALKDGIKAMEIQKDELESKLKDIIKDAEALSYNGKMIATWKQAKPSWVFDKEAFAREQPEFYKQYLHDRPGSRRFLLK